MEETERKEDGGGISFVEGKVKSITSKLILKEIVFLKVGKFLER